MTERFTKAAHDKTPHDLSDSTGTIGPGQIEPGSVGSDELADGSVTTPKLVDNVITAPKIDVAAVTTEKIDTWAVTADRMNIREHQLNDDFVLANDSPAAGQVAWSNLTIYHQGAAYPITNGSTADKYIYWDKSASTTTLQSSGTFPNLADDDLFLFINKNGTGLVLPGAIVVDGDVILPGTVAADRIVANSLTAAQIAAGTITGNEIAANTILATNIAANTITSVEIAANTITGNEIAANSISAVDAVFTTGAITNADIANAAITNAKIANLAVDAAKIANATITSGKIQDLAVTTAKIGNLQVTTVKVADQDVTIDKLLTPIDVTVGRDTDVINQITSHMSLTTVCTVPFTTPSWAGRGTYTGFAYCDFYNGEGSFEDGINLGVGVAGVWSGAATAAAGPAGDEPNQNSVSNAYYRTISSPGSTVNVQARISSIFAGAGAVDLRNISTQLVAQAIFERS